jgi:thymidylate synthase ThyX
MSFSVKLLADSVSPIGHRLTTFEATIPRIVLAEFNTHRVFSRNSASSRAIPVEKMLARVMEDPYVPSTWGQNQKGMQAGQEVNPYDAARAHDAWLRARDAAVAHAQELLDLGIHKQTTNRLLEPFLWHTIIVSATEWSNFENLRDNPAAHPDIQTPAHMIREARAASEPRKLQCGEWHLPLVGQEDIEETGRTALGIEVGWGPVQQKLADVSSARCARVSYLTHDGRRDLAEDVGLFDRLVGPGHLSPLEHAARPMTQIELLKFERREHRWDSARREWIDMGPRYFCGNFEGWIQRRKLVPGEADILGHRKEAQSV